MEKQNQKKYMDWLGETLGYASIPCFFLPFLFIFRYLSLSPFFRGARIDFAVLPARINFETAAIDVRVRKAAKLIYACESLEVYSVELNIEI